MKVPVVCIVDNNYVQHCSVMLASLIENNPNIHFKIFIIGNIKERLKLQLGNFILENNQECSFIEIEESILSSAPLSHSFSLAAYYKVLIPKLIDSPKVLYLDSDIIVLRSIEPLWNTDITGYSHAAVENLYDSIDFKKRLGIPDEFSYFNSGMMLINLEAWRNLNITCRSIEFINKHPEKIEWVDQDVLNYLLHDKWLKLNPTWNAQRSLFFPNEQLNLSHKEQESIRSSPAIVHFDGGGSCKPWYFQCSHPFQEDYYYYLRKTPWRNFQPIKPNLFSKLNNKIRAFKKRLAG